MTRTLPAHVRQHRAGDVEQAEHVGGIELLGLLCARFLDRAQQAVAGIVDQHIDPAERLDGGADGLMCLGFLGDVQLDGQQAVVLAELLGDVGRIAGGGNHAVAAFQSRLRDPCPEPARCPRDEPDAQDVFLVVLFRRPSPSSWAKKYPLASDELIR